MRFERKIFITVFCSTLVIGSLLIWAAHRYTTGKAKDEFLSRYSVLTRVMADTLTRLDTSTEALMMNAAQVVAAHDARKGLLSTDELMSMRTLLGVTHIFVVGKNGQFVRSTNEDPKLIPNLYTFCGEYRGILTGGKYQTGTPIITPRPEPKPYKFLFIPNASKDRIIEVGVRVDSIAKTLVEAIKADKNVRMMSLYSPDGTSFGSFSPEKVSFSQAKAQLPDDLNSVREEAGLIHFYSRAASAHPRCCQCDVAGTSKNGEYYYVLESSVSKDELNAIQARMETMFVLLALINFVLSIIVAKLISRSLVKNIRLAVGRVRDLKASGNLKDRIGIEGKDEVAFLTQEFDRLLEAHEQSQALVLEAEKAESKIQLARVVAHNIRSPIVAIEMMIPQLFSISSQARRVLQSSVKEIKELADKLKTKPEDVLEKSDSHPGIRELIFLPALLEEVIGQKQMEFSQKGAVQISVVNNSSGADLFVKVNSCELKSIISNLINNGIESYSNGGGRVDLTLFVVGKFCSIAVEDFGCGIPQEYLKNLGQKQISFKGSGQRGLGLVHAVQTAKAWGGSLVIESEMGSGTKVTLQLPGYDGANIADGRRPPQQITVANIVIN
jgi:signal transduction histidine kinase